MVTASQRTGWFVPEAVGQRPRAAAIREAEEDARRVDVDLTGVTKVRQHWLDAPLRRRISQALDCVCEEPLPFILHLDGMLELDS